MTLPITLIATNTTATGFSRPLYFFIFVSLLSFLGMIIWNILEFVRFLPKPTRFGYRSDVPRTHRYSKGRSTSFSKQVWFLSMLGFWTGPLLVVTGPMSAVLGLWGWRLLRKGDVSERSRLPTRMAIINGSLQTFVAVLLFVVYLSTHE